MEDAFFIIASVVAGCIILGYLVRVRGNKAITTTQSGKAGFKSRWLRVTDIIIIVSILVLVMGFFMLKSVFVLWISLSILMVALIVGHFLKQWKI
jgi:hypothetical protein